MQAALSVIAGPVGVTSGRSGCREKVGLREGAHGIPGGRCSLLQAVLRSLRGRLGADEQLLESILGTMQAGKALNPKPPALAPALKSLPDNVNILAPAK